VLLSSVFVLFSKRFETTSPWRSWSYKKVLFTLLNKAVINRRDIWEVKRPKSSPVCPLACNWYYCAQFIAEPKAPCALHFSWAATASNLGLWANMTSSIKPTPPPEENRAMATWGNTHKNLEKIGWVVPKIWSRTGKTHRHTDRQTDRHVHHNTPLPYISGAE